MASIHVAHLVYSFSTGGLENVVTQLINGLPHGRFRHSLITVSRVDPQYLQRITRSDVEVHEMNKGPGQPFKLYPRMRRLLSELRPDVLHSCNMAALDFVPAAAWAGVQHRVHAEHGWSVDDPGGHNRKLQRMRRFYRPWVHDYVAVSDQLQTYLQQRIGVPAGRVHLIENGVDLERFRPATAEERQCLPESFPFDPQQHCIVGTVGRLEAVKHHRLLLDALARARREGGAAGERLRLVMVGDGPLRQELDQQVQRLGLTGRVWMAGNRQDVPVLLRAMHVFVLCSLAEGTSCALQEALGTGLYTVATDVGGNRKLLDDGRLGRLIGSGDEAALAQALLVHSAGNAPPFHEPARGHAEQHLSVQAALDRYAVLFASRC